MEVILRLRESCIVTVLWLLTKPSLATFPVSCVLCCLFFQTNYHRFRWYATFENKTPAETFPKFPSIMWLVWPSDLLYVMLAGCDWWISIRPVDNMHDWRKFWKRFRGCFVFESRVSMKTVVSVKLIALLALQHTFHLFQKKMHFKVLKKTYEL